MDSVAIQERVPPASDDIAGRIPHTADFVEKPARFVWGALYASLLVSVGLCLGGIRLAAVIGHSSLLQYGVALAILGLLGVWVRRCRWAMPGDAIRTGTRPGQPFSVIRVSFPPKNKQPIAAIQPGAEIPRH